MEPDFSIDCVHGERHVHVKHSTDSIKIFNHVRYTRSHGIVCHCNFCEFYYRLMRAVKNDDPYLAPNMILKAKN